MIILINNVYNELYRYIAVHYKHLTVSNEFLTF